MLSQLDIVPLCLVAAHLAPPRDRVLDGCDPLPTLAGEARSPHDRLVFQYGRAAGLLERGLKLVRPAPARPWELHELATDPGESRDLAGACPADVARLESAFLAWRAEIARDTGALDLAAHFPRYTDHGPAVPIYVVSAGRTIHRFFDTSPISPSGRYLALFRLPREDHGPRPGDAGEVVLVDLRSGRTRTLASSRGWEMQVGANVQWGGSDAELYSNDVDPRTWKACAIRLNPATGERRALPGTVFMASRDGTRLASHDLLKSRRALPGYGVVVPDEFVSDNIGPTTDDGVWVTDVATGKCRLLASLDAIYRRSVPSIRVERPDDHVYHVFQVKWNPQGTRLVASVRWRPRAGGKTRMAVVTMSAGGEEIRTAVTPDQWARGGHHMCWCPDGERLSMNLNIDADPALELITVRHDGTDLREVHELGSGHPSFHPGGRYIVTDSYPGEPVAAGDGTVPIRLIDTATGKCRVIARIEVSNTSGELRVDPHPAWDPSGRYVVFNGRAGGTRKVYVADLTAVLR